MFYIILITTIFTFFDQIIKIFINRNLILNESVKIIPGFFNITLAHNYGAAWSILNNKSWLLIIIAIAALIMIYFNFIKNKQLKKLDILLMSMLISGIIGNMIDRIRLGYVIDYLDFILFGYDYPIFNFADILIVVAMIILAIKTFKEEKNAKIYSKRN